MKKLAQNSLQIVGLVLISTISILHSVLVTVGAILTTALQYDLYSLPNAYVFSLLWICGERCT